MSQLNVTTLKHESAGVDNITLDANGRVGIGTSSPTSVLHASSSSNTALSLQTSNASSSVSTNYTSANRTFYTGVDIGGANSAYTIYDGTAGAERMRIDSAGRVTMPYQPAFFARTASNIANTGAGSPFQYPVVEFNIGGHYNSSNWTFTAPVTGAYLFSAHCILNNYPVNNSVEVVFSRNNGTSYYFDRNSKTLNVSNRYSLGGSAVIYLGAGDSIKVFVYADTSSSWSYESSSNFSGFLIG